jgi:hypothetical protein
MQEPDNRKKGDSGSHDASTIPVSHAPARDNSAKVCRLNSTRFMCTSRLPFSLLIVVMPQACGELLLVCQGMLSVNPLTC